MSDKYVIETLNKQIESLIDKDKGYKLYEAEIASLKVDIEGLERLASMLTDEENLENTILRHNANLIWKSYKTNKQKREKDGV